MELVKINFGKSLFYYIYLLLCVGAFLGLYFGLRKKSKKVQYWVLFGVLAFNFVLHFLKLCFPQYIEKGFPEVIRKCSFENICAVSTMVFPFMFLSKSKACKDYMFYLGVISGIFGCVAPMPVKGLEFYQLEVMRYYICHASIWIIPLLMVIFGLHTLDYRRIWKTFAIYFLVLGVIIVNELILIRIGWVSTGTLEDFFNPADRDMGYAVGVPEEFGGFAKYILWLTPKCFKDPYVPILWEFFPVIILGGAYALLLSMYWEHEHFKNDVIALWKSIKTLWGRLIANFKKDGKLSDGGYYEAEEDSEELTVPADGTDE